MRERCPHTRGARHTEAKTPVGVNGHPTHRPGDGRGVVFVQPLHTTRMGA